jgi:hypothetical protein
MAVWRWLIIGFLVLLCLGACTAVPDPTPTPVQNVAEVATLVVERPSATSLPTLTPTPQPTNTPELVVTDEMPRVTAVPTVTPVPTFTPIPSPTPDPHLSQVSNSNGGISHVTVSSLGQLAFIEGSVLWVETAAGAGEFVEVGRYAQPAVWSPDGSQLLYSLTNTFDIFHDPNASFEQRLWSAVDGSDISLSELITNYSSPPYNVFQAFWSPDSTKILMQATLDKRHEDDIIAYDNILLTIDFSQHTLKDDRFISSKVYPVWFAHDVYILRYHCGSPCAGFASQNYFGESLWFEGSTTGFVDFAATDNFMILAGHTDVPPPYSSTLDEINLLTGEKRVIWEAPSDGDYFTPFFDPSISPDEQFIAFNYGGGPHVQEVTYVLYVIDRNGQEIGQYPRSSFVDPGSGF